MKQWSETTCESHKAPKIAKIILGCQSVNYHSDGGVVTVFTVEAILAECTKYWERRNLKIVKHPALQNIEN